MPDRQPTMMTIREVARTGILSEHALRLMVRDGKLPVLYIGRKALINYDSLCEVLQGLKLGYRPTAQDLFSIARENPDA